MEFEDISDGSSENATDDESTEFSLSDDNMPVNFPVKQTLPTRSFANFSPFDACIAVLTRDLSPSQMTELRNVFKFDKGYIQLGVDDDDIPYIHVIHHRFARTYEFMMIPEFRSQQKIQNTSFGMKIDALRNRILVKDHPDCQKLILKYCRQLFPMMTLNLMVNSKSYRKLTAMTRCDHLYVNEAADHTPFCRQDFNELLMRMEPMHGAHFHTYLELFRFGQTEKLFTMSSLTITNARWVTGNNLLDMKNKKLQIWGHNLTDVDINRFIVNWKNGRHPEFRILALSYNREPSDALWKDLDAIRAEAPCTINKLNRIKGQMNQPIVYSHVDLDSCMEVVPEYGSPASIFFDTRGEFRQLHMVSNRLLI